jgi:AcrR family transcriptional regulator
MVSKKDEILENSMQMFAEADYASVSMQKIADSVGIKKASLYFHFVSKEELLRAVVDKAVHRCTSLIASLEEKAAKEKTLVAALYSFLSGYIEYIQERAVLQFWTRLYIFPPQVLDEKDMNDFVRADEVVHKTLSDLYSLYSKASSEAIVMTLIRLVGGYISLGTDEAKMPWKKELLLEIKVILRGFMPRQTHTDHKE